MYLFTGLSTFISALKLNVIVLKTGVELASQFALDSHHLPTCLGFIVSTAPFHSQKLSSLGNKLCGYSVKDFKIQAILWASNS